MARGEGILDDYHLGEALRPNAAALGRRCGKAAVDLLCERFAEASGAPEADSHSYVWRSAIEEHEQDRHKRGYRHVLIDALRDCSLAVVDGSPEEARSAVRALLTSPYASLTRVGIFVCAERYGAVGEVFWECFRPNWFTEIPYWHEVFWLVKKAFRRFSASQRTRFLEEVKKPAGKWAGALESDEDNERLMRDLLHPASGQGDVQIDALYEALVERVGGVREHPDFHAFMRTGWVVERSPVPADELVRMSNEELVGLMETFTPDRRSIDAPSLAGLAQSLSKAVRLSDDGFEGRMSPFLHVRRAYQHGLLRGLKERWSDDRRQIHWDAALAFMREIVGNAGFKAELSASEADAWEPSATWIVQDVSGLLKNAADDNNGALKCPDLLSCIDMLEDLLEATSPSAAPDVAGMPDADTHPLNSPWGQTFDALIHLALAIRRREVMSAKTQGLVWDRLRPIFERELVSSEQGLNAEFATFAGMYLANIHYLSGEWVEANFDRLFSTANKAAWRCAAQGFQYQSHLYDWLYVGLVRGGHLRKMVFAVGLPDAVRERALEFTALAYVHGLEEIGATGSGLLADLVAEVRGSDLAYVCWFLWSLRGTGKEAKERRSRVLGFWQAVSSAMSAKNLPDVKLLSALTQLSVYVDELEGEAEALMIEAAPHAQVDYHGYVLMKELRRLAPSYPEAVARVFLSALEGFVPDFDPDDVIGCVEELAKAGRVDAPERICNEYVKRGSSLLNETYARIRALGRQQARP